MQLLSGKLVNKHRDSLLKLHLARELLPGKGSLIATTTIA